MEIIIGCSPVHNFRGSRAVLTLINPSHVKRFKVCAPVHFCNHKSLVMKTICRGPYKDRFHTTVNTPERWWRPLPTRLRAARPDCLPEKQLHAVQLQRIQHFHVCQQTPLIPDPLWVTFTSNYWTLTCLENMWRLNKTRCRGQTS